MICVESGNTFFVSTLIHALSNLFDKISEFFSVQFDNSNNEKIDDKRNNLIAFIFYNLMVANASLNEVPN